MSNLTNQELAAVLGSVIFEVVAVLSPNGLKAVDNMEQIANRLHEAASATPMSPSRQALVEITAFLMSIERGS